MIDPFIILGARALNINLPDQNYQTINLSLLKEEEPWPAKLSSSEKMMKRQFAHTAIRNWMKCSISQKALPSGRDNTTCIYVHTAKKCLAFLKAEWGGEGN